MSGLKLSGRVWIIGLILLAAGIVFFFNQKIKVSAVSNSGASAIKMSDNIWKNTTGRQTTAVDVAGYNVLISKLNLSAQEPLEVLNTKPASPYQAPLKSFKAVKTYPVAKRTYAVEPIDINGGSVRSASYPQPVSPSESVKKS